MNSRIVFFGTPDFVVPVLEMLAERFNLVGVVTTPDVLTGRKKILTPTPVKQAYQHYLEETGKKGLIIDSQHVNPLTLEQVSSLHPDLFVVAAYGKLVPQEVLDIPKYGSLNIHPSLLPKYRGPSPIQTALLNGDHVSGVTIIKMDDQIDHGPIVAQKEMKLNGTDTFASLHKKMFSEAASMLSSVIEQYVKGTITPQEQNHSEAVYCEHITRQDGYFDITNPPSPEKLGRMIRAYYPWPTAWTKLQMASGKWQIVKFLPEERIQLEGGKPMSLKDLFNGHPELKRTIEKILNT